MKKITLFLLALSLAFSLHASPPAFPQPDDITPEILDQINSSPRKFQSDLQNLGTLAGYANFLKRASIQNVPLSKENIPFSFDPSIAPNIDSFLKTSLKLHALLSNNPNNAPYTDAFNAGYSFGEENAGRDYLSLPNQQINIKLQDLYNAYAIPFIKNNNFFDKLFLIAGPHRTSPSYNANSDRIKLSDSIENELRESIIDLFIDDNAIVEFKKDLKQFGINHGFILGASGNNLELQDIVKSSDLNSIYADISKLMEDYQKRFGKNDPNKQLFIELINSSNQGFNDGVSSKPNNALSEGSKRINEIYLFLDKYPFLDINKKEMDLSIKGTGRAPKPSDYGFNSYLDYINPVKYYEYFTVRKDIKQRNYIMQKTDIDQYNDVISNMIPVYANNDIYGLLFQKYEAPWGSPYLPSDSELNNYKFLGYLMGDQLYLTQDNGSTEVINVEELKSLSVSDPSGKYHFYMKSFPLGLKSVFDGIPYFDQNSNINVVLIDVIPVDTSFIMKMIRKLKGSN